MKISSVSLLVLVATTTARPAAANLPQTLVTQTRRLLNLGSLFGNPRETAATPYDRIMGHPVFQVTTAWGSAYMNMEKLTDVDDSGVGGSVINTKNPSQLKSLSEEQNQYRTVSLYFMDPDDALATHAELKQMEQMKKSDIRITAVSLGKALRSAANLGAGLVTGYPMEPLSGNLKSVDEGGSLRHKIMPPKRQLYYAARCVGKERVGLFGANPAEDASSAVLGNSALESLNLMRRREKADRKSASNKPKTAMQAQNAHMEGYTGIPVFWAQGMQRRPPLLKRLISGNNQETPMFFNYEDLMGAWAKMKKRSPKKLPDQPNVEVFNLWDVLTSMEKEEWKKSKAKKYDWGKPIRQRLGKQEAPDLDSITFVPSSRCIDYKEKITARGNGKARLRPMR
mmetsp:Transcript_8415/g.24069  ORF Transcript_8415/g.24069 Transcript_8415/m.24069 type:complete len:397 (-) Transcript_8415:47-1237(-)